MKKLRPAQLAWIGQAALIVLPVIILSGVAFHFLREDRTMIEQDAKNRAYSLGPEAARQIGAQITTFLAESRKKTPFAQGEMVFGRPVAIPDYPRWPSPDGWPYELSPRVAELWRTAQDARFEHPNPDAATKALTALSDPENPAPVRASARLGLLVASETHADPATLIRQAIAVSHEYGGEVTESGTPVGDLALLVALRHVSKVGLPDDLVTAIENNIALHPSFLSTDLMDQLDRAATPESGRNAASRVRATWQRQEAERNNLRALLGAFSWRFSWMSPGRERYPVDFLYSDGDTFANAGDRARMKSPLPRQGLALFTEQQGGWRVTLARAEPLRQALHVDLPDYMGASLNLYGERWDLGAPRTAKFVPLAYANGTFALDNKYPFQLVLDLQKPDLLYARYHRQLLLTQSLVWSAIVAALLGLWRLWQTYRDQTRLSEMKSNLVSSVSHELRAPIAAVRLMAESLETGRVSGAEKERAYYRLIVRECRRLSSLVENVLDFSRIDQGRKEYHPEPLDALALLRHTVMLMEPGAAERHVRLRLIEPPPDFESLQPSWDSEAVEQSMVNLLDNAIKHSPANREVRVEVELLPAFVRFWVVDQGPGIPAEEHQKIFDLFYRYGSELRRETEGVGIGLSIVKHVAEAHGGRVLVESAPGQGSRFGLELPI